MAQSTVYDIVIKTQMTDTARKGAADLNKALTETTRKSDELGSSLRAAFGLGAGIVGIKEAYHATIGFNAEMQSVKTSLSALIMMNFGGSFGKAKVEAEALFNEFQRFSKVSPVTTAEVAQFGQGIAAAAFGAGADMKQFINLTEMGVIAAKVFGVEANVAQMQMTEMLLGNVRKTERFTMMMLSAGHMSLEAFRALDAGGRKDFLTKTLNSDAMKEAQKAMGAGWEGVTTTLKDNLQIFFGAVGKPLFEAVTKELQRWNDILAANGPKLEEWGKTFADALITGFHAAKDTIQFIADHKDLLIAVGMAWAAGSLGGGGFIGGALGGLGEKLAGSAMASSLGIGTGGASYIGKNILLPGLMRGGAAYAASSMMGGDTADNVMTGVLGGLSALPGPLGWLGAAATLASVGIQKLAKNSTESYEEARTAQGKTAAITDWSRHASQGDYFGRTMDQARAGILKQAADEGFRKSDGTYDLAAYKASTGKNDLDRRWRSGMGNDEARAVLAGIGNDATGYGASKNVEEQGRLYALATMQLANDIEGNRIGVLLIDALNGAKDAFLSAFSAEGQGRSLMNAVFGGFEDVASRPQVNVTIQHIDVQADDPDRFVFGIVEIARQAIANPGNAGRNTVPQL
jgi:hypothetical protein